MRNTILLSSLILFCSTFLGAQPINKATPEDMLDIAREKLAENDYYTALEWFKKYQEEVEDSDIEVDYEIAQLEYQLRDFKQAERQIARILRSIDRLKERKKRRPDTQIPSYPDLRLQYGKVLKMNESYDKAIEEFTSYISEEAEDPFMVKMAKIELTGAEMAKVADDIPGLENTTFEQLAGWLWREIKPHLPHLSEIAIHETPTSRCIYRGD